MISIRDDAFCKLDYFKRYLPGILNHRLEIVHLDQDKAKEVIKEPIIIYNEQNKDEIEYSIEEELTEEILKGIQEIANQTKEPIELFVLQLVMCHRWKGDIIDGKSQSLKKQTFLDLYNTDEELKELMKNENLSDAA